MSLKCECGGKITCYVLDTEINRIISSSSKEGKCLRMPHTFVASKKLDGTMFCSKCGKRTPLNLRYDFINDEIVTTPYSNGD